MAKHGEDHVCTEACTAECKAMGEPVGDAECQKVEEDKD